MTAESVAGSRLSARRVLSRAAVVVGLEVDGMATALAVTPDLPNRWRAGEDVTRRLRQISWSDKTLASAAGMARVRHQLRRIARGNHPMLGTSPLIAFVADNGHQTRALRRYRSWLRPSSATTRHPVSSQIS